MLIISGEIDRMRTRRDVLKKILFGLGLIGGFRLTGLGRLLAAGERKILPPGTRATLLFNKHPVDLDIRNLAVSSINVFGTMGQSLFNVDADSWRLEISGLVSRPLTLSYRDILNWFSFQRKVLLICPGEFSYLGNWKCLSLIDLLRAAGLKPGAGKIEVHGPTDLWEKIERFDLEEVAVNKIILAHGVNGQPLPERHGFPLRLVAEDHYGDEWVKCVVKVVVQP
jgi:DMSO/TMAO reductase YedYZ molybdopterin-dependent catalytic subunit